MNIVQVSTTDLPGRRFNGYDLHLSLRERGYNANQIVIDKNSSEDSVIPLLSKRELFIREQIWDLEEELNIKALLFPYSGNLEKNDTFKNADIVHYHLIKNGFISIQDFSNLTKIKNSIWTVHEPWLLTGNCTYPLECDGWLTGCNKCDYLDPTVPSNSDKSGELWKIKKNALNKLDINLVVSCDFMIKYLTKSPITEHLKNIYKIPFGVQLKECTSDIKMKAKEKFNISKNDFVIGFRNEINPIKGSKYIEQMLREFSEHDNISIITVGKNKVPNDIKNRFKVIELGWINDSEIMDNFFDAVDLFLMPSLAETFGVMSIEAMAHMCCVVVFKETVLEEITHAPKCGLTADYRSVESLKKAVISMLNNKEECIRRGVLGREIVNKYYKYSDYVDKHIVLYNKVLDR